MSRRPRRSILLAVLLLALKAAPGAAGERRIIAPPGSDLGLPFSPGVVSGDFLYLAGAIGNQPGTSTATGKTQTPTVTGDAVVQTRQTMENLRRVLEAAGLDFSRVVAVDLFVADARRFGAIADAYRGFFSGTPPALTAVEAAIAVPGAEVEIAMIAALPGVAIEAITPSGWQSEGIPASWAIRAGDTLFLSGMVATDGRGHQLAGDLSDQVGYALGNVDTVLTTAGLKRSDVASCRVFLADARGYTTMNDVYGAIFAETPPARATVQARPAAHPDLQVAIQCTAVAGAPRRVVVAEGEAVPARPFSPAIQAGDRLFVSGFVASGPQGYPSGVAAQTRAVLAKVRATLAAAGLDFRHVDSATVFLADIRDFAAMNEIYREVVGTPAPARATVGTRLMTPEALVEIQVVARRGE